MIVWSVGKSGEGLCGNTMLNQYRISLTNTKEDFISGFVVRKEGNVNCM